MDKDQFVGEWWNFITAGGDDISYSKGMKIKIRKVGEGYEVSPVSAKFGGKFILDTAGGSLSRADHLLSYQYFSNGDRLCSKEIGCFRRVTKADLDRQHHAEETQAAERRKALQNLVAQITTQVTASYAEIDRPVPTPQLDLLGGAIHLGVQPQQTQLSCESNFFVEEREIDAIFDSICTMATLHDTWIDIRSHHPKRSSDSQPFWVFWKVPFGSPDHIEREAQYRVSFVPEGSGVRVSMAVVCGPNCRVEREDALNGMAMIVEAVYISPSTGLPEKIEKLAAVSREDNSILNQGNSSAYSGSKSAGDNYRESGRNQKPKMLRWLNGHDDAPDHFECFSFHCYGKMPLEKAYAAARILVAKYEDSGSEVLKESLADGIICWRSKKGKQVSVTTTLEFKKVAEGLVLEIAVKCSPGISLKKDMAIAAMQTMFDCVKNSKD